MQIFEATARYGNASTRLPSQETSINRNDHLLGLWLGVPIIPIFEPGDHAPR